MPIGTAFIRIVTALVLSIPLLLGFTYYLGAIAVSNTLLRPSYLLNALEENRLYERIYSEVLMEERFDEWMARLAGGIDVAEGERAQLLRGVVPPEYIRGEVERSVASITTYLNGQSNELSAFIDLRGPIESVRPTVLAFVDRRIDALESRPVTSVPELADEMARFLAEVREGRIPSRAPEPQGMEPAQMVEAYRQASRAAMQGEQDAVRQALEAGDVRAALKAASHAALEPRVDEAVAGLTVNLDAQGRLDLVEEVARDTGRTRGDVLRDARIVRVVMVYGTGPAAQIGALALMGLSALAIFLVFVPYWRHAVFWPSAILLVTGLLALAFWWLMVMDMPFWTGLVCQGAQQSPCDLSLDIARSIAMGLGTTITEPSVVVVAIGMAGVLLSLIMASLSGRRAAAWRATSR